MRQSDTKSPRSSFSHPLIIYGAGRLARLLIHYFSTDTDARVLGIIDDSLHAQPTTAHSLPVMSFEQAVENFPAESHHICLAIGYARMRARREVYDKVTTAGYSLASYISSAASVDASANLGANSLIFPGVVIEPFVTLGDNNLLWSNATVCHDSCIGQHNFIAANTTIGGNVNMGNSCFLGFSSTVIENLNLANETLLGARSLLMTDTESAGRYLGLPAQLRGRHPETGIEIQ